MKLSCRELLVAGVRGRIVGRGLPPSRRAIGHVGVVARGARTVVQEVARVRIVGCIEARRIVGRRDVRIVGVRRHEDRACEHDVRMARELEVEMAVPARVRRKMRRVAPGRVVDEPMRARMHRVVRPRGGRVHGRGRMLRHGMAVVAGHLRERGRDCNQCGYRRGERDFHGSLLSHSLRQHPSATVHSLFAHIRYEACRAAARRSWARPSASARAMQPAITGTTVNEIVASSRPKPRSAVKSQLDTASEPRNTTRSITFFALYFSSRSSTVKKSWKDGLEIAKLAVRWIAWNTTTTARMGESASTMKPSTKTSGRNAAPRPAP